MGGNTTHPLSGAARRGGSFTSTHCGWSGGDLRLGWLPPSSCSHSPAPGLHLQLCLPYKLPDKSFRPGSRIFSALGCSGGGSGEGTAGKCSRSALDCLRKMILALRTQGQTRKHPTSGLKFSCIADVTGGMSKCQPTSFLFLPLDTATLRLLGAGFVLHRYLSSVRPDCAICRCEVMVAACGAPVLTSCGPDAVGRVAWEHHTPKMGAEGHLQSSLNSVLQGACSLYPSCMIMHAHTEVTCTLTHNHMYTRTCSHALTCSHAEMFTHAQMHSPCGLVCSQTHAHGHTNAHSDLCTNTHVVTHISHRCSRSLICFTKPHMCSLSHMCTQVHVMTYMLTRMLIVSLSQMHTHTQTHTVS